MHQPTYTDSLRMEVVLAAAHAILAEAEEIALGRKVRITIYGAETLSWVYPMRVAAHAARLLGASVALPEAPQVAFCTHGATLRVQPSGPAYHAFLRAILAHNYANMRRNQRALARQRRRIAQREKGGYHE
jgi:hypothetical protein